MLSDAALALAAECDAKWLYNTARRTGRPLERTIDAAFWWRLVHHLAIGVGISVADAVRAADALLAMSPDTGRVKLLASRDESVAVSVDLSRFHDSAAIAVSSAMHRAVPKRRGRPPRQARRGNDVSAGSAGEVSRPTRGSSDLERAISAVRRSSDVDDDGAARATLESLADAGIPFVITGAMADIFRGRSRIVPAIDIAADTSGSSSAALADLLNALGARPRGVPVRNVFRFDTVLIRSASTLALRTATVSLNIACSLPVASEFQHLVDSAESVMLAGRTYRIASIRI